MATCLEKAVHSVYIACLQEHLTVCVCVFFPFGSEDGMWDYLFGLLVMAFFLLDVVQTGRQLMLLCNSLGDPR